MIHTRSYLVVTREQVRSGRLRPEQGGRFHEPVGPPADHPARQPEVARFADTTRASASLVEPIPEEPRTIHDAKVGDRVKCTSSGQVGYIESFDLARRMVHVDFGSDVMERMPISHLHEWCRLAPPGGGA